MKSKTTIRKIAIPTAKGHSIKYGRLIKQNILPEAKPMRWLPITFFALAESVPGIANTINVVAPIALIRTILSLPRVRTRINTATVANRL